MNVSAEEIEVVERLLDAIPELGPLHQEHLRDNDFLLPHMFMGSVTWFALEASRQPEGRHVLKRILDVLEAAALSDAKEARDLVTASFVYNLLGEEELPAVRSLMGPTLLKQLDSMLGG